MRVETYILLIYDFSHFNPCNPHGLRPLCHHKLFLEILLQSMQPMWVATRACDISRSTLYTSIHATHADCDSIPMATRVLPVLYFNTRNPYRLRLWFNTVVQNSQLQSMQPMLVAKLVAKFNNFIHFTSIHSTRAGWVRYKDLCMVVKQATSIHSTHAD